MANTYKLIEAKTLASAVSSITFSSIPQTYTDLQVLFSARGTTGLGANVIIIEYNGNGSSYNFIRLMGYGSGANSGSGANGQIAITQSVDETANTFSNNSLYIPNYTSANYKSLSGDSVNENNDTETYMTLNATLWSNTAAITSLKLTANGGNFVINSTFYLYGISNS
jgi:hypothetical protein